MPRFYAGALTALEEEIGHFIAYRAQWTTEAKKKIMIVEWYAFKFSHDFFFWLKLIFLRPFLHKIYTSVEFLSNNTTEEALDLGKANFRKVTGSPSLPTVPKERNKGSETKPVIVPSETNEGDTCVTSDTRRSKDNWDVTQQPHYAHGQGMTNGRNSW